MEEAWIAVDRPAVAADRPVVAVGHPVSVGHPVEGEAVEEGRLGGAVAVAVQLGGASADDWDARVLGAAEGCFPGVVAMVAVVWRLRAPAMPSSGHPLPSASAISAHASA